MKYLILLWSLATFLQGCDILTKDSDYTPLIPDETPFIVGVLEATDDTLHHYPEVYVGYLSQPKGFEAEKVWTTEGIWWPVVNALVTRPVTRMDLKRVPDTEASVAIRGPLNHPAERTVQFTHEGGGIYGDVEYELSLVGGATYELSLKMSDSRSYMATTQIPELFTWNVPDSIVTELELKQFANGVYYEQQIKPSVLSYSLGTDIGYIVYQKNSEYDYHNFDVPINGNIRFDNQSNFLRGGAAYGLADASAPLKMRNFQVKWIKTGGGPSPIRQSEYWWLTLNQLNKSLSNFYYSVFKLLSTSDSERWDHQDSSRIAVQKNHDSSYLFDYMSNIKKIDASGEVLPEEQSDAFGVFGAYSAAYRNLTVIPQRSWDPDTLNWGNQGN